jgi:hypothetical protein
VPCLAALDPRVDLGQSATGASRRMANQPSEWVGGAEARRYRGVELQPKGMTLGAAGSNTVCSGKARRTRAHVGRTGAYEGGGGRRGLPAGQWAATSRPCSLTLRFHAVGPTREPWRDQRRGGSCGGERRRWRGSGVGSRIRFRARMGILCADRRVPLVSAAQAGPTF